MTYTTSRNWPADWRSGRWSGALLWTSRVWGHETETHSKRQPNSQVKVPFEDPAGWLTRVWRERRGEVWPKFGTGFYKREHQPEAWLKIYRLGTRGASSSESRWHATRGLRNSKLQLLYTHDVGTFWRLPIARNRKNMEAANIQGSFCSPVVHVWSCLHGWQRLRSVSQFCPNQWSIFYLWPAQPAWCPLCLCRMISTFGTHKQMKPPGILKRGAQAWLT